MSKVLSFLQRTIDDPWWIFFFSGLLVFAFVGTLLNASTLQLHNAKFVANLGIILYLIAGFTGVIFTILAILVFAFFVRIISWFFHISLAYNLYVRIITIDILLRLFLGLNPWHVWQFWQVINECISALYLAFAVWAAIPLEKRQVHMLLIGAIPSILSLLFLIFTSTR